MKKYYSRLKTKIISKKQPLIATALLTCVVGLFQNCQQKEEFFSKAALSADMEIPHAVETPAEDDDSDVPAVIPPDEQTLCENGSSADLICNPLGGGNGSPNGPAVVEPPSVPVSRLGLIGNIYEGQSQWNHMDKYFSDGYKHSENIYFSNFDVPLRAFSEGFGYGADDYLKNRSGDKLIEWFAIKAKGHITLPESEAAGNFHIVTISDDGIKVTVNGRTIISNLNVHAQTIDCASELVSLAKGEEKSFELGYFQGPRMHIALMTFIKRIDSPAQKSKLCGAGNSNPQALIAEGYKVISSSWFTLPEGF